MRPRRPGAARRNGVGLLLAACVWALAPGAASAAGDTPEYRLKAAFVYNFLAYVEGLPAPEAALVLCVVGRDPFGGEIDALRGRPVGARRLEVARRSAGEALSGCHAVFLALTPPDARSRALEQLRGQPVLTIADGQAASLPDAMIALRLAGGRVVFDANAAAARSAGLVLNSRLLRLAAEVTP